MKGFALLEVLVAMAVLALNVLMVGRMQLMSLRRAEVAYHYAYEGVQKFSSEQRKRAGHDAS